MTFHLKYLKNLKGKILTFGGPNGKFRKFNFSKNDCKILISDSVSKNISGLFPKLKKFPIWLLKHPNQKFQPFLNRGKAQTKKFCLKFF